MSKPIRVLHLPNTLSKKSGVMSFIMNYYRYIDKEKVQFDFLCFDSDDETFENEIISLGGRVYKFKRDLVYNPYKFIKKVKNFFTNHKNEFKIVHYHAISIWGLVLKVASNFGIKHRIAHSHNTKYSDKKLSALRNSILCIQLKRRANLYLACSKTAGEFLFGRKSVKNGKVRVINNAIDCNNFIYDDSKRSKLRKSLNIENNFVVGHIGRFSSQKNHDFLVEIFLEVLKKRPESILMLIGTGPLEENVKRKIEEKKIKDKVLFLGQRNDIQDLLYSMDVFVLPSIFEGLGIVLVEAQAAGLNCFASDVVPIEAKVTDNLTYLNLKLSAREWASNILNKLKHLQREDENKKVRQNGYDIKIEAKNLDYIYLNLK